MMKPFYLTLTALALRPVDAYLVSPPGTAAPGANEDCSGWVYNAYKLSCDAVVNYYGITLGEFEEWVSRCTARCRKTTRTNSSRIPLSMPRVLAAA